MNSCLYYTRKYFIANELFNVPFGTRGFEYLYCVTSLHLFSPLNKEVKGTVQRYIKVTIRIYWSRNITSVI